MSITDSLYNGSELRLKRGTTNEETVNVWLRDKLSAVASVG
jgi:hypothetical protein